MHPVRIRTFHPRRGRLSGRHRDALDRLWPAYGIHVADDGDPLDPAEEFGRRAPLVLEIGSGMGDATAEMAAADPDRDYLAVEVHTPGIAHLLSLVELRGLTNVRVASGDALDLLAQLPPGVLDAVHVFFPDPWPKARHHKRRLIQPAHVALLRSRLAPGGTLHCATDWADYAATALTALAADPLLVNAHHGFAPRPAYRPRTKFEERGLLAGREVFDLVFRRSPVGGRPRSPGTIGGP
jgi:tRNA (guanine-N7-)-methyltransferase